MRSLQITKDLKWLKTTTIFYLLNNHNDEISSKCKITENKESHTACFKWNWSPRLVLTIAIPNENPIILLWKVNTPTNAIKPYGDFCKPTVSPSNNECIINAITKQIVFIIFERTSLPICNDEDNSFLIFDFDPWIKTSLSSFKTKGSDETSSLNDDWVAGLSSVASAWYDWLKLPYNEDLSPIKIHQ